MLGRREQLSGKLLTARRLHHVVILVCDEVDVQSVLEHLWKLEQRCDHTLLGQYKFHLQFVVIPVAFDQE